MIPILYDKSAVDFSNNGIGFLVDIISNDTTEERNGVYETVITYPTTGALYEYITEGAIIKCKANETSDLQLFRIYKHSKPLNGIVTFNAEHISYDAGGIPVAGFSISSATAQMAINRAIHESPIESKFTAWSNISTLNSTSITTPCSLRAILGGQTGSILDVWGGEYEFDNYTIKLHAHRGEDTDVIIAYGKNLTDVKQERNISECYTCLMPFAIIKDENDVETLVTIKEKVLPLIDAENIGHERAYIVDLSSEFEDGETVTESTLRIKANSYIKTHDLGTPKINITASFVNLWQTEEYKNIAPLERVKLCDTVSIVFEKLGINAKSKVIKTVYDGLSEKYKSIELGDAKSNFANTVIKQNDALKSLTTLVQKGLANATEAFKEAIKTATNLITGNSGGYVVLHPAERPQEILILDTPDIESAMRVWRWNSSGLGYSKNGYNGDYGTAITMDGQIVADFITIGTLDGGLLRADSVSANAISQEFKKEISDSISSTKSTIEQEFKVADEKLKSSITTNYSDAISESESKTQTLIEQSASDIKLEVSKATQIQITTAVDGIQIGGTQILRGTNTVTKLGAASTGQGNWSDGAWRAASYGSGIRTSITVTDAPTANIKLGWRFTSSGDTPNTDIAQENINITIGEKYVLSCYARAVSGSPELKIQYGKGQYKTTKFKPTSEWKQYSTAFVLESKYVNDNKFNVYFGLSNTVGTLDICGMKLETGTKPTDWSPAPEDIDSNITTLSNQYTALEQNLSSITATVAKHTTDISKKADNSTVSALSSNVTQLTADLSGFKTTVSSTYTTKTDFNNLEVGGRNLLPKSKMGKTVVITSNSLSGIGYVKNNVDTKIAGWTSVLGLKSAVNYIISFTAWCDLETQQLRVDLYPDNLPEKVFNLTVTPTKYTFPVYSTSSDMPKGILRFFNGAGFTQNVFITDIMIEQGTKASQSWSPAPEDVDSSIATVDGKFANYSTIVQMNAAIKQTADSITSTVSKTYATQTTVNGIESHISTMQSSISQNAANIKLKVSKSNLVSEINQSAGTITLNSNRLVINSDNFKLTANGSVTASNVTLSGSLKTTSADNKFYNHIHGGVIETFYNDKRVAYIEPVFNSSQNICQYAILGSGNYNGVAIGGIWDNALETYYRCNIGNAETVEGCRHHFIGDVKFDSGKFNSCVNFDSNYGLAWGNNIGLRYMTSGAYGAGLYLGIGANSCDTYITSGGDTEIYAGSGKAIKLHSPTYVYGDMTVERANLNMVNGYIDLANTYGITCGGNIAFRWNVSALYCGIDTAPLKLVGSSITLPSGSAVTSDQRLKNHIEPIDDRYMKLLDVIGGKKYFYNDYRKTTRNCGFIAQDLLTALSEVGLTADEFGAFCDVYGDGREYAIDYAQFIPILWEIVKKLKAEISAIKEEK